MWPDTKFYFNGYFCDLNIGLFKYKIFLRVLRNHFVIWVKWQFNIFFLLDVRKRNFFTVPTGDEFLLDIEYSSWHILLVRWLSQVSFFTDVTLFNTHFTPQYTIFRSNKVSVHQKRIGSIQFRLDWLFGHHFFVEEILHFYGLLVPIFTVTTSWLDN